MGNIMPNPYCYDARGPILLQMRWDTIVETSEIGRERGRVSNSTDKEKMTKSSLEIKRHLSIVFGLFWSVMSKITILKSNIGGIQNE